MAARLPHPITAPVPRYYSKTAFAIPLDQVESIIRVTAYHRKDFDRAVIWFPPRTQSNSITSGVSAFHEPTTSLGELNRLPLELINDIFLQLDMKSILYLRQTNTRARHVIDTLHEYRIVSTHALNLFCVLLRTRTASRVRLLDFYHLLCTQTCSLCDTQYGDLSTYLLGSDVARNVSGAVILGLTLYLCLTPSDSSTCQENRSRSFRYLQRFQGYII